MAIKIFVDQGHNPSGFNAGAEGFGYREQDITYMVGIFLANILSNDPRFEVRVSRPTPETVLGTSNATSLRERVYMANSWPADYFISIHVNSNPNPEINGSEVYVYDLDSPAAELAEQVLLEIVRRTGTKNNGVRVNSALYVLRRTQMPSILVELGYISNYDDVQKLVNDQYQFAYGIYVGLLNYLGLPQIL
ncbi:N-acetylmuramoyl-L-alanine amidase family protein [Novisyntrophococcus fermenticellae]|uniref:N-acetylmuramoyl-L-alanine amidase family protein n=1 Tax=Novisyntrophococcus fermenticellae TaxID=2068655 RepID=UPI001E5444E2|nr:N-acetylmuramoyl-L-alanine amidase [Novisyntrophococcus fermenticellae]